MLIKLWPIKIYRRKDLFWIIVLLFFDPIGFTAFETVGMQFTSASQAGMIWATGPIINTVAALIVLKEKTSWQALACFLAAACGVILLTTTGNESNYASLRPKLHSGLDSRANWFIVNIWAMALNAIRISPLLRFLPGITTSFKMR